jgi:plastocyanin
MHRRRLRALVLLPAVLAATLLAAAPPAAAGGGCHRPATEGRGTTLALNDLCFSPTVLRVASGSEHPLARPGGEWGWDGAPGDRATVRLDRPGIYPFFCHVHPSMVGVVVVGDGKGAGGSVVEVADSQAARAGASATASEAAPAAARAGTFPVAWLVVIALAALAGAAAGARVVQSRSGGSSG